jgi:hypothetical protein
MFKAILAGLPIISRAKMRRCKLALTGPRRRQPFGSPLWGISGTYDYRGLRKILPRPYRAIAQGGVGSWPNRRGTHGGSHRFRSRFGCAN